MNHIPAWAYILLCIACAAALYGFLRYVMLQMMIQLSDEREEIPEDDFSVFRKENPMNPPGCVYCICREHNGVMLHPLCAEINPLGFCVPTRKTCPATVEAKRLATNEIAKSITGEVKI